MPDELLNQKHNPTLFQWHQESPLDEHIAKQLKAPLLQKYYCTSAILLLPSCFSPFSAFGLYAALSWLFSTFFHVILVATVSLSFLACSLWAVLKMQEIKNWSALPFNQYTDMKMWCGRSRGAVDRGELDVWKEGKCLREPKIQWCRAISCIC